MRPPTAARSRPAAALRRRRARAARSDTTTRPSTSTVSTSAAVAASSTCAGSTPAVRGVSSETATRSARAPGSRRPASSQPRQPCAVSASSSVAGANRPRSPDARRSCISRPRASSKGSVTACWSPPRASGHPASRKRTRRPEAVGEVALGGGAQAGGGAAAAQQGDVGAGQMRRVHGRCGRAEQALGGEQPGRGEPVGGEARGVLGGLLGEVDVQRAAARRLVHDGQRRTRYRPHRVRRHPDPQPRSVAQRRDPLRPRVGGAVGEPALHAVDRTAVHVRGEVAGVEQGEPDPGLGGGLCQGVAHRVRVGVRAPVRAVVQVVELPHRRDAGQRALGESGAGQGEVGVGVEPGGDGVHALAPGPERACPNSIDTVVGAPAQRPVKGVGVGVGEAGQHDARQPLRVAGGGAGVDAGEPAAVDGERHVAREAAGQQRVRRPEPHGRDPAPARSAATSASAATPARQSARSACSAGAWETPVGLRTNSIAVGTPAAARIPAS